jgi:phage repressor protein C with HTH and peptisase S24 domain
MIVIRPYRAPAVLTTGADVPAVPREYRLQWPFRRILVSGTSMTPALRPGDMLVVRMTTTVRVGDIVLARFAAMPDRLVLKRAIRPVEGGWWVHGDNGGGSDDSRRYGVAEVLGRVVWRYWPLVRRPR